MWRQRPLKRCRCGKPGGACRHSPSMARRQVSGYTRPDGVEVQPYGRTAQPREHAPPDTGHAAAAAQAAAETAEHWQVTRFTDRDDEGSQWATEIVPDAESRESAVSAMATDMRHIGRTPHLTEREAGALEADVGDLKLELGPEHNERWYAHPRAPWAKWRIRPQNVSRAKRRP